MIGSRLGAGVLLLAAAGLVGADAAPAVASDAPSAYLIEATAQAAALSSTQHPAPSVATAGLVDDSLSYVATRLGGGTAEAQGAAFYPGNLVSAAPQLLCQQFLPCPTAPPDYPLLADATYPNRPKDEAPARSGQVGSGPVQADAGRATASAGSGATAAHVRSGQLQLLPGTAAAVTIASAASDLGATVDAQSARVTVTTVLTGIAIGSVRIAALHATDEIVVSSGHPPTDHPRITLSGVTVAGQPATIDSSGVHVAGHDVPVPVRDLAAHGVDLRLVPAVRDDHPASARSSAAGLLVSFSVPVSGVPPLPGAPSVNREYVGTLTLGGVGAAVAADNSSPPDFPSIPALSPGAPSAGAGTAGGLAAAPAVGAPGRASASAPTAPPPEVAGPVGILDRALQLDLSTLYVALVVLTATAFALWRLATFLAWRHR